jgi:hypothetical protein
MNNNLTEALGKMVTRKYNNCELANHSKIRWFLQQIYKITNCQHISNGYTLTTVDGDIIRINEWTQGRAYSQDTDATFRVCFNGNEVLEINKTFKY